MSQTHLSRHAIGILPSKQFFTPRKPISQNTSIKHKTSFPALQNNNDQTATISLPVHQSINITTKINDLTPEEDTPSSSISSSNLQPRSSIALTTFSSNFLVDVLSSHNPTLDQSIDSILNNDGYDDSPENIMTVPVRPSSAVLLTRQKNQDYNNDIVSQQSTTIDSLFEPLPQGLILDPISYRPQITRTESGGVTYPLSKDLMDSSNIFAKDSNINSNNIFPPTPKKDLKPINSSENQQYIFNEFDISYMPHIIPPTKKSKKIVDKNESDKEEIKQKKLYQVWPGRNRFFLGGRIMTSRNYLAFTIAVSTLVIPSGLFLGFTCPFLFHNVSPAVVFVFVYLFLLSLTSMLRTSWSDPGIIPRNLDSLSSMECLGDINNAYYANNYSLLPKEIKVNGQTVRSKYCDTCKIYRPPRSSHCRQCDNCVENEDHHCIWLNNCIGKRNYRTFFTFIASATIICIYIQGFCLTHLLLLMRKNKIGFIRTVIAEPVSFLLIMLAFFLMWSVGGLTCYHGYLISKNLTTHEQIRTSPGRRNGGRNPFAYNNMFANCLWVLCRPLAHSVMNEKSFVYEESLNLGGGSSSDGSVIDGHSGEQQQLSQKMQETQVKTVQETPAALIDSNDKSSETFIKDKSNNVEEVIIASPSLSTSSSTTLSKVQNH